MNSPKQSRDTIYCPYTGNDIPVEVSGLEHIVPKSLGGADALRVRGDRSTNSRIGHEIEGPLANEFLWTTRRGMHDALGHSKRPPIARIKNATYGPENRLAQVDFGRGVRVWDVRDQEYKSGSGSVSITTSMNVDLPIRLTAKVALGAGYYVYGDLFREHVDHCQLREVMNLDPASLDLEKSRHELGIDHLTLRGDNWINEALVDPDDATLWLRLFCSSTCGSVVVLLPGQDCFGVGVGLLGHYLASVVVPAKCDQFPNDGDYAWGHVLAIDDKKLKRCSWVDALSEWTHSDEPWGREPCSPQAGKGVHGAGSDSVLLNFKRICPIQAGSLLRGGGASATCSDSKGSG